jgi:hypothetical protein
MFKLPFEVRFEHPKMSKLPFESMQMPYPELLGAAVAVALVGISAAFLYYTNKRRGIYIYMICIFSYLYLGMRYIYTCLAYTWNIHHAYIIHNIHYVNVCNFVDVFVLFITLDLPQYFFLV